MTDKPGHERQQLNAIKREQRRKAQQSSAQECGSKGGPHGNISAWKSNITAWIQNKALFLHGEITNLPLIIQCIDFVPFLLINGTWKRINIASMSYFLHIHFSQAIQVLPLPREGYIQHASIWNIVKQTFCIIPSQVFSIDCSINRFEAILNLCCIFFTWNIYEDHTQLLSAYNYYTSLKTGPREKSFLEGQGRKRTEKICL